MPKYISRLAFVALSSLFLAGLAQAQTPAPTAQQAPLPSIESLEQQSAEAFAAGDVQRAYDINLQLHQRRPHTADYMVNVVRAAALQGRKTEAYEMMLKIQRQGLSYDFNQIDDTLNIRKTELYMYINDVMIEAGQPVGEGQVAFTLPGAPADFQTIAWDASRGEFLVGTAARGTVLAVAEDGSTEVLLQAGEVKGMWSVNGLGVDGGRKRLWISTAATPAFEGFLPADQHRGALLEFNLETLELVNQFFLPVDAFPHELGSLALTDDGHVYVIDRAMPVVYRKAPDSDRLEAFVGSRELESFSDLAVAPDNSRLFVADRVLGVFVVDPVGEQAAMLSGPDNLNLSGIEGIEYAAGKLFIVQGGLQPQRLMRLELAASGSVVESVAPMAVALPGFDRPGVSAILGPALYYFANPAAAEDADAVQVMRTPLESGESIVPPDLRKYQQSIEAQQQKQD